jgi:hypothetical protein
MTDPASDEATFVIWTDNSLLLLGGFILIVVLLFMLINPPKPKEESKDNSHDGVLVEIQWPTNSDSDVDLWVKAPGDVAVGYSNKQSKYFDLLRDDTGQTYDDGLGNQRHEEVYSRGIPAGEYIINVHSYRVGSVSLYPILVRVKVSVKVNGFIKEIERTQVSLTHINQEVTAVRFTLGADHYEVPGSINHLFQPIRNWGNSN